MDGWMDGTIDRSIYIYMYTCIYYIYIYMYFYLKTRGARGPELEAQEGPKMDIRY